MNSPLLSRLLTALSLSLLVGPASAITTDYAFQIDSFWVFRNVDPNALENPAALYATQPLFMDDFSNGSVPGSATDVNYFSNGTPAIYTSVGFTGPEQNSKLTLSRSGMVDNTFGTARTNVTLNTNTDSNPDPTSDTYARGLKAWNDNFFVMGVWDFTNPGNNMGSYGIRFNDSLSVTGNDIISLSVQGRTDGQAVVSMLHFNNLDGSSAVLDRQVLELGHQQIALGLGYLDIDGNGSKEVGAGYFFLDNGTPSNFTFMNATTTIFHGENWTRAAFFAADSMPAPVPEPATYAMMVAGLGLVGYAVRRRRRGDQT